MAQGDSSSRDSSSRDSADLATARSLFESGRMRLEAKQYAQAAEDFGHSLELVDRTATRFNLAIALCGSGKYIEGIEEYERLLRTTDLGPDKRNEVIQRKAGAETQLARVALTNEGTMALDIFVDGEKLATANTLRTVVVAVNPGKHEISAQQVGVSAPTAWRPQARILNLKSGQTESHTFKPSLSEPTQAEPKNQVGKALTEPEKEAPIASDDEDGPVWPWIVLAVAAVGGVTVAAIVLSGGDEDTFDARAETLGIRF